MKKGNSNPWKARQAIVQKRLAAIRVADMEQASRALAVVINDCLLRLDKPMRTTEFTRIANTIVRAALVHVQVVEAGFLEDRVTEMEKKHKRVTIKQFKNDVAAHPELEAA